MSGPLALPRLSCRKCGKTNPPVYLAPVTTEAEGSCICLDCAKARQWLDSDGNLRPGIEL
jgi:hypothetical protein